MHRDDQNGSGASARLRGTLSILAFVLAALVLTVAIERPHWFSIRPASGTAAAMFHAGDAGAERP